MAKKSRPNVVIVITDDQGYGDLARHGNPVAHTPNMDRLHDESVRLVDFHSSPMCTPTRGQLLTGLDAARNGAVNVSSGRTLLRADLPDDGGCLSRRRISHGPVRQVAPGRQLPLPAAGPGV